MAVVGILGHFRCVLSYLSISLLYGWHMWDCNFASLVMASSIDNCYAWTIFWNLQSYIDRRILVKFQCFLCLRKCAFLYLEPMCLNWSPRPPLQLFLFLVYYSTKSWLFPVFRKITSEILYRSEPEAVNWAATSVKNLLVKHKKCMSAEVTFFSVDQ